MPVSIAAAVLLAVLSVVVPVADDACEAELEDDRLVLVSVTDVFVDVDDGKGDVAVLLSGALEIDFSAPDDSSPEEALFVSDEAACWSIEPGVIVDVADDDACVTPSFGFGEVAADGCTADLASVSVPAAELLALFFWVVTAGV